METVYRKNREKRFSPLEKRLKKIGRRVEPDRRSTASRRLKDSKEYLINGGLERRSGIDRRQPNRRRIRWVPTTYWKSLIFK